MWKKKLHIYLKKKEVTRYLTTEAAKRSDGEVRSG
jgi:hypothetical protein